MIRRNILISTIKDFDNRSEIQYYYVYRGKKKVNFCDAMASGEAGAKNVLSKIVIDEIIAIGSDFQAHYTGDIEKVILREGIDFYSADINAMTDFDFFRYRLLQFIEGMDIEAADIYGQVPKDRQKEIIAVMKEVFENRLDMAYNGIVQNPEGWKTFLNKVGSLNQQEMDFARRYLYHSVDEKYRIHPKEQNENISIAFIPISSIGFDRSSMKNIARLTNQLKAGPDEEVHLYVDMHGFSHEESYIFLSMIQALSDNPMNRTVIEEITSIGDIPKGFLYKISNARDRYKVELLLSGINAFINYGKVDLIRDYWKNTEIKNEYIDKLMYAMDSVDTGMTLCNIDELEKGIRLLRTILRQDIVHVVDQEEESFILALRAGIINDYGPLVSDDEDDIDLLELVKWAFAKGFYQQAITIIESRLPQDMVKRGILYYAQNEEEKLACLKAFNSQYWDSSQKDRYIFQNPNHFFIKYYGRFMTAFRTRIEDKNLEYAQIHAEQVFDPPTYALPAHTLLDNKEELVDILYAYYEICALRNSINHATREQEEKVEEINYSGESPIKMAFREGLNQFIRKYINVSDKISEKQADHVRVMITAEELSDYTCAHGPKDDPECFAAPGYVTLRERRNIKK